MKPDACVGELTIAFNAVRPLFFRNLSPEIQLKLTKAEQTQANLTEAMRLLEIASAHREIGPYGIKFIDDYAELKKKVGK